MTATASMATTVSEATRARAASRLPALDWMRGLVMVLMAIDHSSDAFNAGHMFTDAVFLWHPGAPLPAAQFLTRWITHICAPTFLFLAGTSLAFTVSRQQADGDAPGATDRYIFVRGVVIAAFELWVSFFVMGHGRFIFQVLYGIGSAYVLMVPLRRLPDRVAPVVALALIATSEVMVVLAMRNGPPTSLVAKLLLTGGSSGRLFIAYPTIPWLAILLLGWSWGRRLVSAPSVRATAGRDLARAGLAALVLFAVLRGIDGYGNMHLYRDSLAPLQWLHVSKYPPSITYDALELGLMALILAAMFRLAADPHAQPEQPPDGPRPNPDVLLPAPFPTAHSEREFARRPSEAGPRRRLPGRRHRHRGALPSLPLVPRLQGGAQNGVGAVRVTSNDVRPKKGAALALCSMGGVGAEPSLPADVYSSMRKLLHWAFTLCAGVAPLAAARASEPPANPPVTTQGFSYLVDAEICPHPEDGLFEPRGFGAFELAVRNALLPESDLETILQVVVEPSFATPFSISLQRTRAGEKQQLRLVRAKKNLWAEMMQEMQRQQGSVIKLGQSEQRRALEKVSTATETLTVTADGGLANQLVALWTNVLARTQYANEVLTAPDGASIATISLDGTTYHFWHDGRSASTHSPEQGTLLHEVVGVTEDLLAYIEAPKARQAAVEATVKTRIGLVLKRVEKNEPCLRIEPWVPSPDKRQLSR